MALPRRPTLSGEPPSFPPPPPPVTNDATQIVGLLPSGYTLSNVVTFDLVAAFTAGTTSVYFAPQVTVSNVPEPASVVMFFTGLSLPLVFLDGRRRRHPGTRG